MTNYPETLSFLGQKGQDEGTEQPVNCTLD